MADIVKNSDWTLREEDGKLKLIANDTGAVVEFTKNKLFSLLAIIEEARKYV